MATAPFPAPYGGPADDTRMAFAADHFRRDWPLMALLIGSVFEYRFGRSPSVTLLELISIAIVVQIILDRVALGERFERQIVGGLRPTSVALPFIVWSVICAVFALSMRNNSLNVWLLREYFPALTMLLAYSTYGCDRKAFERLVTVYLWLAAVTALIGISQILTGKPEIVEGNWAVDKKMDFDGSVVDSHLPMGFSNHPNGFAAFFMLPMALLIYRFRAGSVGRAAKLALLTLAVLIAVAVHGTHAKGAWAWVILVSGMMLLGSGGRVRSISWAPLVAATAFAMTLLFASLYLYDLGYESFATIVTRVNLWKAAWIVSSNDPQVWVFGNGQPAMRWVSWRYADIGYPNAHSGLVNIPLFYGAPGAVFFLFMYLKTYGRLARSVQEGSLVVAQWAILVSLAVYFWNGLFEPHFESGATLAQFFLCITLAHALASMAQQDQAD